MSWQSRDWKWVQTHFPRGTWINVQDFSENLNIEVKLEHQSKYYQTVGVTLFGLVASFWIKDIRDTFLSTVEKRRLTKELEEIGRPAILNVTFAFISDDLRHNQAFVQHVNLLALNYVKANIIKGKVIATYARSDGAPTQFQNATQHFWIGKARACQSIQRIMFMKHKSFLLLFLIDQVSNLQKMEPEWIGHCIAVVMEKAS